MPPVRSSGVLLYRMADGQVQVLLGHMGGPFWAKKDDGAWSIPKGEHDADEDAEFAARREFAEELGTPVPATELVPLGEVRARKVLTVWAGEGELDVDAVVSNTFDLEWPPRSGRRQEFPEIDRAAWFDVETARARIVAGQRPFLDRLLERLGPRPSAPATMSLMAMDSSSGEQSPGRIDDRQHAAALRWWADSERALARLVERLTDDELAAPSALPGWSRAHVVAHLARNADALVNLLTWARTGDETPMYPSRQVRDQDIASTATQPPAHLRTDLATASARLSEAMASLPDGAWTAEVRNGQGRPVPAAEIPWMRAKEVWVHGVDLRAGLSFADLPADFCAALVDEVLELFDGRQQAPPATIVATDVNRSWGSGGPPVQGPVAAVAAWLTRSDASGLTGEVPQPPAWL